MKNSHIIIMAICNIAAVAILIVSTVIQVQAHRERTERTAEIIRSIDADLEAFQETTSGSLGSGWVVIDGAEK